MTDAIDDLQVLEKEMVSFEEMLAKLEPSPSNLSLVRDARIRVLDTMRSTLAEAERTSANRGRETLLPTAFAVSQPLRRVLGSKAYERFVEPHEADALIEWREARERGDVHEANRVMRRCALLVALSLLAGLWSAVTRLVHVLFGIDPGGKRIGKGD